MKRKLLLAILCCILLLNGCSMGSSNSSMQNNGVYPPDVDQSSNYGSASYSNESIMDDEEAAAEDVSSSNTSQSDSTVETDIDMEEDNNNQKLVYTCDITMQTLEYDQTMKSIKDLIKKYKGIIETENQNDSNTYWYDSSSKSRGTLTSYLTIRIPVKNYDSFLDSLDGNGKILSKNMQVENITRHYSEVATTITSLQTQEKRLLDMMEKSSTIEDMITVEARLTEVQNQLAQYKNTLASLDTDVAYSTVNLTVKEVVKYVAKTDTFMERLSSTFSESKEMFLSFLEGGLFAIILFGPIILVLGIVIVVIVIILRKIIRRLKPTSKPSNKKKRFRFRKGKGESGEDQKKSEDEKNESGFDEVIDE